MNKKDHILKELSELDSSLSELSFKKTYSVPDLYFDNLAEHIISRIKETEGTELNSTLQNIRNKNIFSTPDGYFDGLEEKIMDVIRMHADYQNANEEINAISPLLIGIPKNSTYQTPAGYFDKLAENINPGLNKVSQTKVVSLTSRNWFRLAAAAVVIGFFSVTAIFYLNQNKINVSNNPDRWISKTINKVSTQDIEAFINAADPGYSTEDIVISKPVKTEYVKTLLQDVSDSELQHFLDDVAFDYDEEATLLN